MPNLNSIFQSIIGVKKEPVKPYVEQGVSGAQVYGGYIQDRETNSKLSYLARNNKYEEIIANIAIIAAGLRYFTALATTANWSVEPNENDTDGQYAEITEKIFSELENNWSKVVAQSLNFKWFGFSTLEWTANRNLVDGNIYFKTIENRPQRTIEQFDLDENGNVIGFGQRSPLTGQVFYIPRKKTIYLVDDVYSDSPAGLGVLRHIFESSERLANYLDLEKQGFEKDLRNIPIGRAPLADLQNAVDNGDITQAQLNTALSNFENIVKIARKQSTTGLLLESKPYISQTDTALNVSPQKQWDLELLDGQSPGLEEINVAIERLQREIARVIGVEGIMLDSAGSNAMAKEKNASLYLSINAALQEIKFGFNKDILGPFWKLNGFPDEMKPEFKVEDVNQQDAETTAAVLRDMATAGAPVSPDDDAINDIRNMLGISQIDLEAATEQILLEREMNQALQQSELDANNNNLKQ